MSKATRGPPHHEKSITLRNALYTYFHLTVKSLRNSTTRASLDAITARTYLTSALFETLGLTGSAIPIDILKVTDQHVWIRVPREDASVVAASLAQWINAGAGLSFKVEGKGEWLGGVVCMGEIERTQLFSLESVRR